MIKMLTVTIVFGLSGAGASLSAAPAGDLATVDALYTSADYEGALTVLDRLGTSGEHDITKTEQYRALCYVALGQTEQAAHAIERIVSARPDYRVGGDDVSPRFATLFSQVRRQVLPDVVKRRFAADKEIYQRGDVAGAALTFRDLRQLLDDPELTELVDLRTIVDGYLTLSEDRLRAATAARPAVTVADAPARPAASAPAIYSAEAANVTPPVVITESLPHYTYRLAEPLHGVLAVVIGEDGRVVDARMLVPTNTPYDPLAVAAARKWQFRPALLNGQPVRFEKAVNINIAVPQTR